MPLAYESIPWNENLFIILAGERYSESIITAIPLSSLSIRHLVESKSQGNAKCQEE